MRPVAWILVVVGLAIAACGPSDPMQSREAKECRQLLAVWYGWGAADEKAKERAEAENPFAKFDPAKIDPERDRAVAACVLRMKGGLR